MTGDNTQGVVIGIGEDGRPVTTGAPLPLLDRAMTPDERRKIFRRPDRPIGLHAAPVGSGPGGETCGSCRHLYRRHMAGTYLKCDLCRAHWTRGGATDVKARDPACSKWQKIEETE